MIKKEKFYAEVIDDEKADGKEENIERKLQEAKEQLSQYSNSPKFKGMDNLKKWAVVFASDRCVRNEELSHE